MTMSSDSMSTLWWHRRSIFWTVALWIFANLFVAWWIGLLEGEAAVVKNRPSRRADEAYERGEERKPFQDANLQERHTLSLHYRVLRPTRGVTRAPLVVFLHGAGERGGDNTTQLIGLPDQLSEPEMRTQFPCICLAPQCPEGSSWTRHLGELERLVEEWRSDPQVDPCRIYLTGLSMGGFGTWELAGRRPDLFAAAVPICGGGHPSDASKLVRLPIWAVHGQEDRVVPASQSRAMIEAIQAAGGQPKYTELPGVGHDSWTGAYRDPMGPVPWLFRQTRDDCRR